MADLLALSQKALKVCDDLALFSEVEGQIHRTYLSPPMREVHRYLQAWMAELGMLSHIDAVGNLTGIYSALEADAPRFYLGSHLDTVPNAGKYDGILGVVLALCAIEALEGQKLPFALEVIGFSEEEGVRFKKPFFGSLAFVGQFDKQFLSLKDDQSISLAERIQGYGLKPEDIPKAQHYPKSLGYLEVHIEQGPVLEAKHLPLAVVSAIAGQSRFNLHFMGKANHAGTTPMNLRHDALTAAASFILAVESLAQETLGLVATVGKVSVLPGAGNIVPGEVELSLDVRHAEDTVRLKAIEMLLHQANMMATARGIDLEIKPISEQKAVNMSAELMKDLLQAMQQEGYIPLSLVSGAGHDAMIVASSMPTAMIFLRSPKGLSHHPEESVIPEDVHAALKVVVRFLKQLKI
ncbi:MAG: allantoate amidohydrolase [Deinococcales bacterium]